MPPDTNSAITRSRKDEVIRENSKACDKIPMTKAVVVDVVAVREAEMHDFRHGVHYRIKHPVIICSFGIIRLTNTGFGIRDLPQKKHHKLCDKSKGLYA